MGKFVIAAGLLLGGALIGGTPAKAELGCVCAKLGQPFVCTSGINACTTVGGGACVLPCDYQAPKKATKVKAKAKAKAKAKPAQKKQI